MSTPAPEVFVTALANAGSSIHVSEVQTRRRRPSDVLDEMLTRVSHLDLSGKVTKLDAHLKSGGSYADIYLGCLNPDGQVVAIRQLRSHIFQEASELKKSIAYELRIWSNLHHPNVLPLKGYTLDFGQYPAFVTEWMANGTVLEFVKCTPEADYLRLSIGIAAGLNYLHVNGIVHADMKSSNVVVSPQGEPLLIDFGLSRILDISRVIMTTREASGTFRWMAFELCGGGRDDSECGAIFATRASDIWAYGMIVLELLSKEYPYSHLRADFQVYTAIHNGQLPPKPQGLSTALDLALWTLCNRCWLLNPSLRPSASDILYSLTLLENTVCPTAYMTSEKSTNPLAKDLMGHVYVTLSCTRSQSNISP
ncbi:kinase-like protein [Rickenella mellea]|uniref:Kinase-like protein n=1 Tax=Rickenella mellea TaxID=50990 RepID=A0A4Y7PTD0_9AGAM|nr:kinase-like protein [Rickenella mellea]